MVPVVWLYRVPQFSRHFALPTLTGTSIVGNSKLKRVAYPLSVLLILFVFSTVTLSCVVQGREGDTNVILSVVPLWP